MTRFRRNALVSLLALTMFASSCATTTRSEGISGPKVRAISPPVVSGTLLGLTVAEENVDATVEHFERSFADAISVYSFRRPEGLLEATLQVSRFMDPARLRQPSFRAGLAEQLGSTRPVQVLVGSTSVSATRGNKQRLFVWYRGRYVFVLAVRDEFREPRNLLREAVALDVENAA